MSTDSGSSATGGNDRGVIVSHPPSSANEAGSAEGVTGANANNINKENPATQHVNNTNIPNKKLNDENTKPAPTTTSSSTIVNVEALGQELGNPTGNDIVLVPVNPRLSAPSIAAPGSLAQDHIDRRKRLFAAKRFFSCDADVPAIRKKRVAKKSLIGSKEKLKRTDLSWDDYFQNANNPHSGAASQSTATSFASGTTTSKSRSSKPRSNKPRAPRGDPPKEVYRGPPDEDMSEVGGWPPGWIKTLVERKGGNTAGRGDRYWYSPGGNRFRSMKEVKKFLTALRVCEGDEDQAKKMLKNGGLVTMM